MQKLLILFITTTQLAIAGMFDLPFGWQIGKTTYTELSSKLSCEEKNKSYYGGCSLYGNDKLKAKVSQDGTLMEVEFFGKFPKSYRNLGISMKMEESKFYDFLQAHHIKKSCRTEPAKWCSLPNSAVHLNICSIDNEGQLHEFTFPFNKEDVSYPRCATNDPHKLLRIKVSESY